MKKWYNTHDSMTIIVMKLYFTPGGGHLGLGGKKNPSTFFSQWTNSGVSVDIFAHLKNILPKEFKFFPVYHWNFAKMLRLLGAAECLIRKSTENVHDLQTSQK